VDWHRSLPGEASVEEKWQFIKETIHKGMENFIPKIKVNNKKNTKPAWLNKKAMRSIKKKYKLYKRYLSTKSGQDYLKYIEERNFCNKTIRKARKDLERTIALDSKTNPKKFWKYVQEKTKVSSGISTLKKPDGSLAEDDEQKADTLNNFFSSVFIHENKSNLPSFTKGERSNGLFLSDVRVTAQAVELKLKELDPNKAQGPDLIPPRVLKELHKELAVPLCILFNDSLETGVLPMDWNKAEVTAIFKKGNKADPGNYRPVSLTCILCKVLESFVRDSIVSFFDDNHLYSECQHGFRKRRSCVSQLIGVLDELTALTDKGQAVDIIYLDFRKAFDAVPHERLLCKLQQYGIVDNLLLWIRAFLSGRSQKVRVGNYKSNEAPVLSGIPQGSILGPILFTVFINDLPENILSPCRVFADDTKIYNSTENSTLLQEDLYRLQEWTNVWNLYFNIDKCKVMHAGKQNPEIEYKMKLKDGTGTLSSCVEEKDLGVIFDRTLSFDVHIQKVVTKANQMVGIIRRTFEYLNKEILLKLYKSLVRPHLEYANCVWYPHLKRQSVSIEKVQRRATKLIKECKDMNYSTRLKYLGLHSLKGRRLRGDLIETYKIFHGLVDVKASSIFSLVEDSITRNADSKIFVEHTRKAKSRNTFRHRVAKQWNELPPSIKNAPTLNAFKNRLDSLEKFQSLFVEYDE
jgi:hypothetical protein